MGEVLYRDLLQGPDCSELDAAVGASGARYRLPAAGDLRLAQETTARAVARDALDAIVCAPHPDRGLLPLFDACDVGARLLPELAALRMDQIPGARHKENLRHSIIVCSQAPAERITRWGALCHDLGKAPTRRFVGGKITFHNHEVVGAKLTRRMLTRLGFDAAFAGRVARLVELSGRTHDFDDSWTDSALRRVVTEAGDLLGPLLDLSRADCTSALPGRRDEVRRQVDAVQARIAAIRAKDEQAAVRPALDGHAIAAHLGIEPGPLLGEAYRHLRGLALAGVVVDRDSARAEHRWWAARS